MEKLDLRATLAALRAELADAVLDAADEEITFPVAGIEVEFQVGVTSSHDGRAGIRFWLLELGGSRASAAESVQTLRITLDPPVDREGLPIRVSRESEYKP